MDVRECKRSDQREATRDDPLRSLMPKHPNSSVNSGTGRTYFEVDAISNFRKDPSGNARPRLTCKRITLSQWLIVSEGSWIGTVRGLSMGLCLPSWTNKRPSFPRHRNRSSVFGISVAACRDENYELRIY